MGDKAAARREMIAAGVPVVPGSSECVSDPENARAVAREIGYPVIIKPSGGGGGIGMTIAGGEDELSKALESAQAVARNAFGIGDVYLERYLPDPRHIEFQIVADSQGNVVHLGERECSIQRRHQKLIEESPVARARRRARENGWVKWLWPPRVRWATRARAPWSSSGRAGSSTSWK